MPQTYFIAAYPIQLDSASTHRLLVRLGAAPGQGVTFSVCHDSVSTPERGDHPEQTTQQGRTAGDLMKVADTLEDGAQFITPTRLCAQYTPDGLCVGFFWEGVEYRTRPFSLPSLSPIRRSA